MGVGFRPGGRSLRLMPLPVTYEGKRGHYHCYRARGPILDEYAIPYSTHMAHTRKWAWFWAWSTWLSRSVLRKEI